MVITKNVIHFCSESISNETVSISNIGSAENIDKLKLDLCHGDDLFDKFIVEVTNCKTSKSVHFI